MGTERTRELRRRRHRKKKVAKIIDRANKGGDKGVLVEKLRRLTPGAQVLIDRHGLA